MNDKGRYIADILSTSQRTLASDAVSRQLERQPDAAAAYGAGGFPDLVADTAFRVAALAEAVAVGRAPLFDAQIEWLKIALHARDVPLDLLTVNLECLAETLAAKLPAESSLAADYVISARAKFDSMPSSAPTHLHGAAPHVDLARRFLLAVLELRCDQARALLREALAGGMHANAIVDHILTPVQMEVGRMWQMDEVTIAEEHLVSEIVEASLRELVLASPAPSSNGRRVILSCVGGDLHSLGLRMVAHRLHGAGWETVFLGADLPAQALSRAVDEFGGDLLCLGATLVLHVRSAADAIAAVRSSSRPDPLPILVGGKPFKQVEDLWQVIGADAAVTSADEVLAAADRLMRPS